ncbi:hypothetical protein HK101_004005 [Irineochytrium annulatum]|nr:hypothetical protein HK101_004005 [Irineochytrium annulatum]
MPSERPFIGTGGNNRRRDDDQPEWMESFDKKEDPLNVPPKEPDLKSASDTAKSSKPPAAGMTFQPIDEIQRFKQQMREQERLDKERVAIASGVPLQATEPSNNSGTFGSLERQTPPNNTNPIDMMFGPGGIDLSKNIFDDFGAGSGAKFKDGAAPLIRQPPENGLFGGPDAARPKATSRFNKFFESSSVAEADTQKKPSESVGSLPGSFMNRGEPGPGKLSVSEQQQLSNDLMARLGVGSAKGINSPSTDGPPANLSRERDSATRHMPSEEDILKQLMAAKGQGQQYREHASPMHPSHGHHGQSLNVPPLVQHSIPNSNIGMHPGLPQEELMQRHMFENMGGMRAGPPSRNRILTEDDILRMQGRGDLVSRGDPRPMGSNVPEVSHRMMLSEEEVLMELGARSRPYSRPIERGTMGPPNIEDKAHMNRILAMLSRNSQVSYNCCPGEGAKKVKQAELSNPPLDRMNHSPTNQNPMNPMRPQGHMNHMQHPMGNSGANLPPNFPVHMQNMAGMPFPPQLHHGGPNGPNIPPGYGSFNSGQQQFNPMGPPPPHFMPPSGSPNPMSGFPRPLQPQLQPQQLGPNSLYRSAMNGNLGGNEDQLAAMIQSSIMAKKMQNANGIYISTCWRCRLITRFLG